MAYPSNTPPVNTHALTDANYIANVALPINANNATTAALDLLNPVNNAAPAPTGVAAQPFPVTRYVICDVATTASASGNSINMNIVVQHAGPDANGAANASDWANLTIGNNGGPAMVILVQPGASATNATDNQFLLPPNTKRFLRARAVGVSNMGNLSDGTLSLKLLF